MNAEFVDFLSVTDSHNVLLYGGLQTGNQGKESTRTLKKTDKYSHNPQKKMFIVCKLLIHLHLHLPIEKNRH